MTPVRLPSGKVAMAVWREGYGWCDPKYPIPVVLLDAVPTEVPKVKREKR